MMVRFRIDGDCQDYTFVPKAYEKNLTTRLKLLANMNITESRLPQDGAIKGDFGGQYLDMRVSALPLNEGEKIVIRILDYTRSLQGIDSLGFHPKNLEKIKRMMGIPNGIILTTGATGSGKSTTTYSILQGLNKPEMNVITVEDPIEMNIEGINQVQVNAEIGMTFAAALRSILRQDPNVILIGEIRDSETAQIAVRASITGHLVLSTIHTNNALATVERLLDMDVERYLLSTALSGIISQRLAKMLCPDCRYQRETTKYEKKVFKKYMHMDVATVWDANPKGCDHCRRGYHGRIAVHEVLEIDDNIREALSNEHLDKKDLAKMVYSGSTITMLQDALIKCLEGKTSFEEVYRTIEIENEDDDNYENEMATEIKDSIPVEPYEEEDSDDLLDDGSKKSVVNDVSSVIVPPSFTPADFADTPTEGENTENNQSENNTTQAEVQTTEVNTVDTTTVAPVTTVEQVQTIEPVQQIDINNGNVSVTASATPPTVYPNQQPLESSMTPVQVDIPNAYDQQNVINSQPLLPVEQVMATQATVVEAEEPKVILTIPTVEGENPPQPI
jgi:type II secretory ATPase GspE/PulE/Tfp pilus assembly ATPase PilB-like protein